MQLINNVYLIKELRLTTSAYGMLKY